MKNMKVKEMTTLGILCAFAIVINLLAIFPLVPAVPWLTYDPKDIIIVIGGFIYGPFASFMMSAICSIIEIMIKGGTVLDVLMDVIATCSFACVAAAIYKKKHTKQGAINFYYLEVKAINKQRNDCESQVKSKWIKLW